MSNRLTAASSPYLLQHADNPVHWYEWGEDAFTDAVRRDLPVMLSVGYATCHWCHVMAHESFEDSGTAAYLNDHFVNIKVDREERPDIDRIYMDAVQATTGRGGWPMTVFLTPGGEPFFAGTYFPREPHHGYPSFRQVLERITAAWTTHRAELTHQAGQLTATLGASLPPVDVTHDTDRVAAAVTALADTFDGEHGGFGSAPKFPQPSDLELLMRVLALDLLPDRTTGLRRMLATTLDAMASGGIHDQLAGGFSRYSVDREWLVPHFEKMLYDNALLARIYLRSWQVLGDDAYRDVAVATLDYLLTDLADPSGGFHSGEDADSEGEEGRFYVWHRDEFVEATGDDPAFATTVYGVSGDGNFDGNRNVLSRPLDTAEVAERFGIDVEEAARRVEVMRRRLLAHRSLRTRPSVDDKIVTAWNGFALRAFAEAGAVLDDDRYRGAARRLATFIVEHLVDDTGRLHRTWRHGRLGPTGFCDDYAATAIGLFTLHQVTGEERWLVEAVRLTRYAIAQFGDPDGGFFATGVDAERLIVRPVNLMDHPTPSDNSLMAEALQMLAAYTGEPDLHAALTGVYRRAGTLLERHPTAVAHLVAVLATGLDGPREVAIIGDDDQRHPLSAVVWERFRPDCVVAHGAPGHHGPPDPVVPLLEGRTTTGDAATAYVCRRFVCDLPVTEPDSLRLLLGPPAGEPSVGSVSP